MTPVEQLDQAARRILDADGFAAKMRGVRECLEVVAGWAGLKGRAGVHRDLAGSCRILRQLADGIKPRQRISLAESSAERWERKKNEG